MEETILFISQIGGSSAIELTSVILKIFDSGLSTGILFLVSYFLWKELKEERTRNDSLTDKIITNNIVMQEQLKDIIELLKDKK
jgi:hypothetical protein